MTEAYCERCDRPYQHTPGRGGRSPFCADCREDRRRKLVELRMIRKVLRTLDEMVEERRRAI